VDAKSLETAMTRLLELVNSSYTYALLKSLFSDSEKFAKFGIFSKIFDKICTFWQTKNGIFGGKILWSL